MGEQNSENIKVLLSTGKTLTVPNKTEEEPSGLGQSDKVVPEKVRNVWGSSSGAGSDFLDTYRKQRNSEMIRLQEMDKKWREDMENKLFHSQRVHRINKESEKTLKRKMKREKRKNKSKFAKQKVINSETKTDISQNIKDNDTQFKENVLKEDKERDTSDHGFHPLDNENLSNNESHKSEQIETRPPLIIVDESSSDLLPLFHQLD